MRTRNFIAALSLALISTATYGEVQPTDSIWVVTSDDLDDYWVAERKVAPEYPERSLATEEQGCVALGFFIEPDGTTSNYRPLVASPSGNFNKSAIKAARRFRYKPSESNHTNQTVYTFNTFTFQITGGRRNDERAREDLNQLCTEAADKVLQKMIDEANAP